MKKGLKSVVAVMLAFAMLTGCSVGNKSNEEAVNAGMATEQLFDDMQKGEAVDAADALEIFDKAVAVVNDADSASINVEISIESTEDGEELKTRNVSKLTYMPNPNAETEETTEQATEADSESATGDDTSDTEEKAEPIAILNVLSEQNGTTNEIEGYYEDGNLYYEMDDKKMKETADFENLKYSFCNYQIGFEDSVVDSAVKVASKKETKYIIKFDNDAMSEMMMNNIVGSGGSTDEAMNVDEAYMYFVVDADGVITGYDMELNGRLVTTVYATEEETEAESEAATEAVTEAEAETATGEDSDTTQKESPFKYSMAVNFSDIGSAVVTPYEDLDSYRDAYEVLAEEQAAAEAEIQQDETDATEDDTVDGADVDAAAETVTQ